MLRSETTQTPREQDHRHLGRTMRADWHQARTAVVKKRLTDVSDRGVAVHWHPSRWIARPGLTSGAD